LHYAVTISVSVFPAVDAGPAVTDRVLTVGQTIQQPISSR
jgi:hypothetical protein